MAIQSNALTVEEDIYEIDISHIVTEDDEPVDNIFSAVQQRLLVEPLYSSISAFFICSRLRRSSRMRC
jgi:hypothetical protein